MFENIRYIPSAKLFILTIILGSNPASSGTLCLDGLTARDAETIEALQNVSSVKIDVSDVKVEDIVARNTLEFCAFYEAGRYYFNSDRLIRARTLLMRAVQISENDIPTRFSPENVLGYSYVVENDFERALPYFEAAFENENFRFLPNSLRVKILNNLGFTYLQLRRYREASVPLLDAVALGSTRAAQNLEILNSLTAVAETSEIDDTGPFAVIVATGPSLEKVFEEFEETPNDLENSTLRLFRTESGLFAMTIHAYRSYSGALADMRVAQDAGVSDAYVASITPWEPVSVIPAGITTINGDWVIGKVLNSR